MKQVTIAGVQYRAYPAAEYQKLGYRASPNHKKFLIETLPWVAVPMSEPEPGTQVIEKKNKRRQW